MGRFIKVLTILLILSGIVYIPVICPAASNDGKVYPGDAVIVLDSKYDTAYIALCQAVNTEVEKSLGFEFNFLGAGKRDAHGYGEGYNFIMHTSRFNELSTADKKTVLRAALKVISDYSNPKSSYDLQYEQKLTIYNFVTESDSSISAVVRQLEDDVSARAQMGTAYIILKPFEGAVGTILGIIALLTVILLGLVTVVDIAFISLPLFRPLLYDKDKSRLMLITHAAYTAVTDAERPGCNKSALGLYFKDRLVYGLLLGAAVLYLSQGLLYWIFGGLVKVIEDILSVF